MRCARTRGRREFRPGYEPDTPSDSVCDNTSDGARLQGDSSFDADFYPPENTDMALKFLTEHKSDIKTVHVLGGETANTLKFFDQIDNIIDPE